MKVACLPASHLPVQVECIRAPSLIRGPLVVGGRPWDPGAVLDCCPQAASTGVHPGMRLSQAEVLCPTAHFVPAHEQAYHVAHDALTTAAAYFTSTVETAGLGLLYAEVSGLERPFDSAPRLARGAPQDKPFGSDPQLVHQMAREAAETSGLDVRAGLGSAKFVALQAAHAARPGQGCVVPPGEERAFLSSLPLSVLPAEPEMRRRLHLLGVRNLGALAALPRLAIVHQFGPHAGPLHDLARGVDPRPVRPDAPPLTLERTHTFNDPLSDRTPLLAHAGQMAAELAEILFQRGYQAEGLRLCLEEERGDEHAAAMPIKPPSADTQKLSRLASRLLGELSPAGPLTALSLTVYPLRPFHLGATQLTLFTGAFGQRQERLREALRRLRERFGEMIVVVASLIAPPPPRPIQVTTDPADLPRALVWRDRIREVVAVYELWRERRYWWRRPVERDYFRLETDDAGAFLRHEGGEMAAGTTAYLKPRPPAPGYVELHAHSDHSLLDGVPSPEALVARAAELGMPALALTDHDALYGAVRFTLAARETGIKPILGAEVTLDDDAAPSGPTHLTLLVETAQGYANLCRLITLAQQGQEKGIARLDKRDLAAHAEGLIALSGCSQGEIPRLLAARQFAQALEVARGYARLFGPERFFVEVQRHHCRGDNRLLAHLMVLATRAGLDVVATGNAHYLHPRQREVHDVLTCIRRHTTLEDAGDVLRSNAEYTLRSPREMAILFSDTLTALETSLHIAERCAPAYDYLPSGPQTLPRFPVVGGRSADFYLRELCQQAMRHRYPASPPRELLDRELAVIKQAGLANYFLVVWDIVRFARRAGIRCQGRGSAANSLVAYLLDISPIDPVACDLAFERFLSPERSAPPDIDIDFAADRREEVIQYVYGRYGEAHAAMACTFVTFRARSAVRDVARVLGFPPPLVERLAGACPGPDLVEGTLDVRDADSIEESRGLVETFGADPSAGSGQRLAEKLFQHLLRIVPQLDGIPRHLGIHNGGMVLSGPPLCELVPLETWSGPVEDPATMPGRVVTQWDKEGLEVAGMIKFDLLGLRMLSAVEDAVTIVEAQTGERPDLDALSPDDPAVYDMLCRGETVGIFQVESRAQSSLIPRFQPRTFADLAIQISLVRPGPIQAQMVHPYLRRRQGLEPVRYLHPLLEPALAETLGVIVFQEQVLKVARDLAGFTPGRAELLRRALSHKRAAEQIALFRQEFVAGAVARGVSRPVAERVFRQLRAFGSYAFPKSHAAAFAVLTYRSAWLRRYHPAAFFTALLRHQPMGFYPPHVVVSEARRCGVEIRPVDVESSDLRASVEGNALRLGLAVVTGLGELGGQSVVEARRFGPFRSLADFCRRTRLGRKAVEALIWAGAFDGWEVPRRQLLWDLQAALDAADGPPTLGLPSPVEECPRFGFLSPWGRLWTEVAHTSVSAREHITALVSDKLRRMGTTPSGALPDVENGRKVWVGGVVVSAQRPPTARGTAFLALEDEGGLINVVLSPKVYEASRQALKSPFVVVEGQLQRNGQAISIRARKVIPLQVSW